VKILYVIPEMEVGGTEKHLYYLASGISKEGHRVKIVCIKSLGLIGERMLKKGFDIECFGISHPYSPFITGKVIKVISDFKPDVLHTYLFGFHLPAGIAGRIMRVPLIISSRRQIALWKKWYHRLFENLGNFFTDYVVACSEAVKEFTLKDEYIRSSKVRVIYNGLPFPEIERRFSNKKVLGMVANFSEVKGHRYILEAVKLLIPEFPDIKIKFAGEGRLLEIVKKQARETGIEKHTFFEGRVDNVFEFLNDTDIFVLPSLSEGLPNAVLEALYMERPVVATRVGGIPEVITSGENGILVEPGNVQQLTDGIRCFLRNPEKGIKMGKTGRDTVLKRFKMDVMVDNYLSLYRTGLRL
jgi:glycosyltransferase involved in cell wall biosynthesis